MQIEKYLIPLLLTLCNYQIVSSTDSLFDDKFPSPDTIDESYTIYTENYDLRNPEVLASQFSTDLNFPLSINASRVPYQVYQS